MRCRVHCCGWPARSPLGALDQSLTRFARDYLGWGGGLLLTGTSIILVYALSVRFLTVAHNSVSGGALRAIPSGARLTGGGTQPWARGGPDVAWRRIYTTAARPPALPAPRRWCSSIRCANCPPRWILRPFNLGNPGHPDLPPRQRNERLVERPRSRRLILLASGDCWPVLLLNRPEQALMACSRL